MSNIESIDPTRLSRMIKEKEQGLKKNIKNKQKK